MTTIGNHTASDEQTETCEEHGDYRSVLWSRRPPRPPAKAVGVQGVDRVSEVALSDPILWSFRSRCPKCDREVELAQQRDEMERDGTAAKDIIERRLAKTGIPRRFVEASFKNWMVSMDQQRRVKDWAMSFTDNFALALETGRGAAFIGTPGTGKTHLAVAIMADVMQQRNRSVLYTTVMDMLGRIKTTYNKNATETETYVVDLMTNVDLLVLDEFGKTLDTNYESAQLFRILDKRYQSMKPTVIVSNLSPADFKDAMGDAAIDRLRENGGKMLNFDWGSHRKQRAKRVARP